MKTYIETVLKRPASAVYSSRLDIRTVATLAKYWQSKGYVAPSVSQLMRLSIEAFADILDQNLCVEKEESAQEAQLYLEEIGIFKSLSSRNRNTLIKQIQTEALESSGIDLSYLERQGKDNLNEDQVKRAKELLEKKQEEKLSGKIADICELPKPVKENEGEE